LGVYVDVAHTAPLTSRSSAGRILGMAWLVAEVIFTQTQSVSQLVSPGKISL